MEFIALIAKLFKTNDKPVDFFIYHIMKRPLGTKFKDLAEKLKKEQKEANETK